MHITPGALGGKMAGISNFREGQDFFLGASRLLQNVIVSEDRSVGMTSGNTCSDRLTTGQKNERAGTDDPL